ncbi:ATP-dependent DNA helicase PcrA [Arthrobacter crystallopoietes BAB-32]|uniref:DNA 3'-5' helicase n=1 Tax=Arthrobacter crystallopoietes BAB-32 TaxID=1246476 RepID=N1V684_9MICC|nr:ATP-dependent DNA helicase [Arthrobacter crystallopoietes]EMY35617.1 ATP-dependent DNA helicase PcrA [Arthrobacter crystallopoietes BAB-32]
MSVEQSITTFSPEELATKLGQHQPTPEQSGIISSPLQPLLVIAGAGSGKTATMADRVVWLVANGLVRPDEILGVTFTRKAAGELAARIRGQLAKLERHGLLPGGGDASELLEPKVSTYHSYANGLVSDYGLRLGIERDVVLLGNAQSWQLASQVVEAYEGDIGHLTGAKATLIKAVMQFASECSEHLVAPAEAMDFLHQEAQRVEALPYVEGSTRQPKAAVTTLLNRLKTRITVAGLAEDYSRAKRERGVLDYGDLVSLAATIAREVPQARDMERSRYKVVLLDEFQDTSHAQMVLFSELFGAGHAVTAVGDPNQSIYGFRGASAGQLFAFRQHFPVVQQDGGRAPAPASFLTIAWRNSVNVLAMANRAAAPLNKVDPNRPNPARIEVPPLQPRPGAGDGRVLLARFRTDVEEAEYVAERVAAARRTVYARDPESGAAEPVSTAVLCRRRAQIPSIARALEARGIPFEIVGLAGLLSQPEIVDLVATLHVLADPGRSDALMRLLAGARWRLGPADLMAFADWSRYLESQRRRAAEHRVPADLDDDEQPAPDVVQQDLVEAASLVEALDRLPKPGWSSRHGRSLSETGLARLERLGAEIRELRTFVGDDLLLLLGEVERSMLLDIEVASKPGVSIHQARRNLDGFQDAAAAFMQTAPRVDLLAFLAWLEVAAAEEGGLDVAQVEVSPDAVQLLTVHASKGLEWDAVFVPGLNAGDFPSTSNSRWSSGNDALPWPLRGDRADLPQWDSDQPDQLSWFNAELDYKAEAEHHSEQEERRLAYVAYTRAKHLLVVSSAGWCGSRSKPSAPSVFLTALTELAEEQPQSAEVACWCADEELGDANPARSEVETAFWPYDPLEGPRISRAGREQPARPGRRKAVEQAAEAVLEAIAAKRTLRADGPWTREAQLLLQDHNAPRHGNDVELPAHISASLLVELKDNPADVIRSLRRPVPRKPGMAARKGTAFHTWVEEYFGTTGMLDLDEVSLPADTHVDEAYDLAAMMQTFKRSEWADRSPKAIEVPVETKVDQVVVRGRIDAVFQNADGTWELVDWKTGTPPSPEKLAVRAVQLAVYRLAWARLQDVEPSQVKAAFYYVSADKTVRPHDLADESELEGIVRAACAPVTG